MTEIGKDTKSASIRCQLEGMFFYLPWFLIGVLLGFAFGAFMDGFRTGKAEALILDKRLSGTIGSLEDL